MHVHNSNIAALFSAEVICQLILFKFKGKGNRSFFRLELAVPDDIAQLILLRAFEVHVIVESILSLFEECYDKLCVVRNSRCILKCRHNIDSAVAVLIHPLGRYRCRCRRRCRSRRHELRLGCRRVEVRDEICFFGNALCVRDSLFRAAFFRCRFRGNRLCVLICITVSTFFRNFLSFLDRSILCRLCCSCLCCRRFSRRLSRCRFSCRRCFSSCRFFCRLSGRFFCRCSGRFFFRNSLRLSFSRCLSRGFFLRRNPCSFLSRRSGRFFFRNSLRLSFRCGLGFQILCALLGGSDDGFHLGLSRGIR